jgi:hypothetical protein
MQLLTRTVEAKEADMGDAVRKPPKLSGLRSGSRNLRSALLFIRGCAWLRSAASYRWERVEPAWGSGRKED